MEEKKKLKSYIGFYSSFLILAVVMAILIEFIFRLVFDTSSNPVITGAIVGFVCVLVSFRMRKYFFNE